jgi:hypothetical protein
MAALKFDPEKWPYAPGNASPEMEAVFAAEEARWPEPTPELQQRISAIFRRSALRNRESA